MTAPQLPPHRFRRRNDASAPLDPVSSKSRTADSFAGEPGYAPWKVATVIVVFCGLFWTGVSLLASRLLG